MGFIKLFLVFLVFFLLTLQNNVEAWSPYELGPLDVGDGRTVWSHDFWAIVDLDVDTNRDGIITNTDERGEDNWTNHSGAIFMVNYDDDDLDGEIDGMEFDLDGTPIWPGDNEINGLDDLKDLTEIVIRIDKVNLSHVRDINLSVDNLNQIRAVRIFKENSSGEISIWGGPNEDKKEINIKQYFGSVPINTTFLMEGLFFRDNGTDAYGGTFPNGYDGFINLTLKLVFDNDWIEIDKVQLKVAPLILLPNNQLDSEVWEINSSVLIPNSNGHGGNDQWTQDMLEIGYTHAPGKPKTHIAMLLPHREVADWAYTRLLGKDFGVFKFRNTILFDGANSGEFGGNIELIPIRSDDLPLGRIIVGDTISDKLFNFLNSQEVQKPIKVDVSWLSVGHIDEYIGFLNDIFAPDGTSTMLVSRPSFARILIDPLFDDDLFFGVGFRTSSYNLTASGGSPTRLIDSDFNFSIFTSTDFKYVRIYEGTGSGQVANISEIHDNFLVIDRVWLTPTEIALGPGGSGNCVTEICRLNLIVPQNNRWFVIPDNTSKYVLVEDVKSWIDGNGSDVPAIITVKEVKDDTVLWDLNDRAQERIDSVVDRIKANVEPDPNVVYVPDIFLGEYDGVEIVDRSSVAFTPSLANVQPAHINKVYFPKSYGPGYDPVNGDVFERFIKNTGIFIFSLTPEFREDWNSYHRQMGGVHCGTSVKRRVYNFDWWSLN